MAGLPYIGLKKEGTPMYGSPNSNKARAAASRVRYAQFELSQISAVHFNLTYAISLVRLNQFK